MCFYVAGRVQYDLFNGQGSIVQINVFCDLFEVEMILYEQ